MTLETMMTCLGILENTYPSRFKGQDKKMLIAQWMMMFGEESDQVFARAIKTAIANCKFCPTFKDMTDYIKRAKMQELVQPNAALPCSTTSIDRDLIEWAMIEGGYTEEVAHEVAYYEQPEHL